MSVGPTAQAKGRLSKRAELVWLGIVVAAGIILYLKTFAYFWSAWRAETQYSLAYLVPFVSGYFLWRKWPQAAKAERSPSRLGLFLIVAALVMHIGGTALDISGPSSVSVLIFVLGCCIYFHGPALVRILWFPLAYLVFAIPVPGGVTDLVGFPLQLWSSGAAAGLLRAVGIEVARNGVNLSVPGFDFQVAEACSGMSSLVALTGVTAVFAYLTRLPPLYKWILFFLAVPIALVANAIRVTTIALVGYQWGREAAMGMFHTWSSPILFVAAVVLLFGVNWGFEWLTVRRTTS
jgi:exosortase